MVGYVELANIDHESWGDDRTGNRGSLCETIGTI